jgi:hypothetical protein
MAEPGVISEYVERLAAELAFDPALSRCVRQEVEDHLWEVVSADSAGDRLEAERRAVTNFGDPHAIAIQFAVASLAKQARRVGLAALVVISAVFIAMKARLTWYAVMGCPTGQMGVLGELLVAIDRYAFWVSVSAERNSLVLRFPDCPRLNGDRSRVFGGPSRVYPQNDAASGVHGSSSAPRVTRSGARVLDQ